MMKSIPLVLMLLMAACTDSGLESGHQPATPAEEGAPPRPMDEVPVQQRLASGAREYRFVNGCVIVLQAGQAVVRSESAPCELYHRDIALLYASAD